MKTKTLIGIFICCIFLCVGCDDEDFNGVKNRQAVISKYSTEIWNLPNRKYCFIARKTDGSVWYVETYGNSVDKLISSETQLFPAK